MEFKIIDSMDIDPTKQYLVWYLFSDHPETISGASLLKQLEDDFYKRMIAGWEKSND